MNFGELGGGRGRGTFNLANVRCENAFVAARMQNTLKELRALPALLELVALHRVGVHLLRAEEGREVAHLRVVRVHAVHVLGLRWLRLDSARPFIQIAKK